MTAYTVTLVEHGQEEWSCVTFPNGQRLIYVETPWDENSRNHHTYWRAATPHPSRMELRSSPGPGAWARGRQLAGASTMVGTFDLRADGLHRWIGREAATSGDADPGREKRELGTRVHRVFERLAKGHGVPRLDALPESDLPYVKGLLKWWASRDPQVLACEQFVMHDELGYAGRYDLRARIGGKVTLIDLKTSKGLYPKYGAQLVAYDLAAEECGIGAADELLILKVDDEGGFTEVPAFVQRGELLDAIRTRKVAARVQRQQNEVLRANTGKAS